MKKEDVIFVIEAKPGKVWRPTTQVHPDGRRIKGMLKSARYQFPTIKFRIAKYKKID